MARCPRFLLHIQTSLLSPHHAEFTTCPESAPVQRHSLPSFLLIQVSMFYEALGFGCGLQIAVPSGLVFSSGS